MADILGGFEQAVLVVLLRLGHEAYGRVVLADVAARLQRDVSAGAVYATLERLERKGLISSRLEAGTPIRGGRARRFYTVKAAGVRALNESRRTMRQVWRGVQWPVKARA